MSNKAKDNKQDFLSSKNNIDMKQIESLRKDIKKLSYEESIAELETILTYIQDENISLDKIKNNYIKGNILLKHCDDLLQCVEQEINEINTEFFKID